MSITLNNNFLNELFRLFLLKKSVLERVISSLKYQMLPSEEYKKVYKDISQNFNLTGKLPTFGLLYELNKEDDKVLGLLDRIKLTDIVEPEIVLKQLEKYIKDVRFQMLFDEVIKVHRDGKEEQAIRLMAEKSSEISEFSIFSAGGKFLKVFGDFQKKQLEKEVRKEEQIKKDKVPLGVLPIDIVSEGGVDRKETVLWIMRSGVGKSTVLRHHGMYACRLGLNVIHVQLEGAEEEVFDKYTQIWSALTYTKVRYGNIHQNDYEKLLVICQEMINMEQDIYIKAFEQFDEASMADVRNTVIDYIKETGRQPDVLILDSIDLCHPGDGLHYGVDTQSIKMKLQNSSRKFKNICNEFDLVGITATQTGDVPMDIWNDPDKVITRSNSMGDKNIANSYSYVFTGNQTVAEEKEKVLRIYFDKVRYYNSVTRVFPICTNYELGRFQDTARTKKRYRDIYVSE